MSLMDALLLEGYRDPRDVYIALRKDGVLGSGTIDDPYHGGVMAGSSLAVSNLSFDQTQVILLLQWDRIYSVNDTIQVGGATGAAAYYFNGSHTVQEVTAAGQSPFGVMIELDAEPPPTAQPAMDKIIHGLLADNIPARLFWPVVRVETTAPHGLVHYDVVNLSGVNKAGTSNPEPALVGSFVVVGIPSETAFYCLVSALPAGATGGNPQCSRRIHRFDEVMRMLPDHCRIRIGPGTFETRGATPAYLVSGSLEVNVGFNVKTAQKIMGSGMGATTLKLVYAVDHYNNTSALGCYASADYCEVSDLTVDGNTSGQPVPAGCVVAPVVCSATSVNGNHTRIRRLRAIHCGTQNTFSECFVIAAAMSGPWFGERVNCEMEECVVEQPSANTVRETTCLGHLGEPNRGSVIRHCFVNAQFANGVSSHLISIKGGSLTPTSVARQYSLETDTPHHRTVGQNVTLNSVQIWKWKSANSAFESDQSSAFNGPFAVDWVSADGRQLKFTLRRNPDLYVDTGTISNRATLRVGSSAPVNIGSIVSLDESPDALVYRITTVSAFSLTDNPVQIERVRVLDYNGGFCFVDSAVFNGITSDANCPFQIIARDSTTTLRIRLNRNPDGLLNLQNSTIGNFFQIGGNPTGTGGVQEGNSIFHTFNGYYSDTGSGLDGVTRDNVYYDVYIGGYLLLGNVSSSIPGKLTCSPGSLYVTFECLQFPHGLWPGATIRIVPQISPVLDPELQGKYFEIGSVPSDVLLNGRPSKFVFKLAAPLSNPPSGTTASVQEYYRVRQFTAENNFIVLAHSLRADCAPTAGVSLSDIRLAPEPKPFIYRQVILKNNIVGPSEDPADLRAIGVVSTQVENGIVQENALRVVNPHLLYHLQASTGAIDYLENQGMAGESIQGERHDLALNYEAMDELRTQIEDAVIMAL